MPRLRRLPVLTAACVLLAGCNETTTISPAPEEFAGVPSTVQVDGYTLTLEVHLWRDFQPVAPPDGRALVATVWIKTTDGRPFPSGVAADRISVVYQGQAWTAPARQEYPGSPPSVLAVVARDGPKWGPGVTVDVVVRLRGSGGQEYLLRAPHQLIGRTD